MAKSSSEQPGCLLAIFKLFNVSPSSDKNGGEPLPYRQRDDFLSAAELSFYRVLTQAVMDKAVICPKVRVGDILFVSQPNQNLTFKNRINQKHVDFVLCDSTSMKPLGVVELDDASHGRSDRQTRDEFLDRAFEAASLPVVHVPVQRGYATADLRILLAPILNRLSTEKSSRPAVAPAYPTTAPVCPKCGITMLLRTAKRGDKSGEQFWGCANYPQCKEIIRAGGSA